MTLLGGTWIHPQHAEVIELRPVIVEDSQYEAQFQSYLRWLESAISKIKELYKWPLKDPKWKLTHKWKLIKEWEELKKDLLYIESSGLAMAFEDSVFQEYLEAARKMAIEILEVAQSSTEFTVINDTTFIQETLENLRKQKILILDSLRKIQEFCTKVDEFCASIQARQNKGWNWDQRVAGIRKQVAASVTSVASSIEKGEGLKNWDRLSKVEARIQTLEHRVSAGKKLDWLELDKIKEYLSKMLGLADEEWTKRDVLLERIEFLRSKATEVLEKGETQTQQWMNPKEIDEVEMSEGEKYVMQIWKYIFSEEGIHGKLSSTKIKWHTTGWDGTYTVTTLRPFLYGIFHTVFEKRRVDFNSTSWVEVIELYEQSLAKKPAHVQILTNALKKHRTKWTFKQLLLQLLETINSMEQKGLFRNGTSRNLLNIQNKLREIIDRFYSE